jgi:hypothetical protein
MPQHFDHKMLWPNRAIFEYSDRLPSSFAGSPRNSYFDVLVPNPTVIPCQSLVKP